MRMTTGLVCVGVTTVALVATLPVAATAQRRAECGDTWVNPAGGPWEDPGNWSAGVPDESTDACITLPGEYTVTVGDTVAVRSLAIGDSVDALPTVVIGRSGRSQAGISAVEDLTNRATIVTRRARATLSAGQTFDNDGELDLRAATGIGTFLNRGTVRVRHSVYGDYYTTWTNSGRFVLEPGATAVMDEIATTFVNSSGGSVRIGDGATFLMDSTFTLSQGSTVTGGPVRLGGTSTTRVNDFGDAPVTFVFTTDGSGLFYGNVASGQTLTVDDRGCCGTHLAIQSRHFVNRGTINVWDVSSLDLEWTARNYGLIDLRGSSIRHRPVTQLRGNLTNYGEIESSGLQVYFSGTLTNHGSITVAPKHVLRMTSARVFNGSDATVTGTVLMNAGVFRQRAGTAVGPIQLVRGSVLDIEGQGSGAFEFLGNGELLGDIASEQSVTIAAATGSHGTSVSSPQGFTNAGALTLLSLGDAGGTPQTASFSWNGTLRNTGLLTVGDSSEPAANVGRRMLLGADFMNSGTVHLADSVHDLKAGYWNNYGSLQIDAGAVLSVPRSDFYQPAPATLQLGVNGTVIGHVRAGRAFAQGSLDISGDPAPGTSYRVLTAPDGRDGTFDPITPSTFTASYSPTVVDVFAG